MEDYIFSALVWSVFGYALGLLSGSIYCRVKRIERVLGTEPKKTKKVVDHHRRNVTLGTVLMLLALVTSVQLAWYSYDNNQRSQCQAEYNSAFARVLAERAEIADEDREALRGLVIEILNPDPPSDVDLQGFLDELRDNEKQRKESPIPDASADELCD